jgi:hypothetical protein
MSGLIVSAVLATAFAAAQPSFVPSIRGGTDEVGPHAPAIGAAGAPTLATSLGSEPFMAGLDNAPPARATGGNPVAQQGACITLATSLGSEPFIFGDTAITGASGRGSGEKLACR